MSQQQPFAPMVQVTRGHWVESLHHGAIAAVDSEGHLEASLGTANEPVFVRSCAKPFQALAFVCSGAADSFGITEAELAVVCSSHSGEPEHIALVEQLLEKTGVRPQDLLCGIHSPFDPQTRRAMAAAGDPATVLHNNCSGKHAAMVATSRFLDLSTTDYVDPGHGVQVAIQGILAYLSGLEVDEIRVSVDGCSAPTYLLPLRGFSLAMARLAAQGEGLPMFGTSQSEPYDDGLSEALDEEFDDDPEDEYGEPPLSSVDSSFGEDFPVPISQAMERVWRAMKNHPFVIAGSRGRLCTDLMRVAANFDIPLVAKSGAEGSYAIASIRDELGIGITIKVEDGSQRARDAASIETLFQLDILPEEARGPLAGYHRQSILNCRNEPVGEVRPAFKLSHGLPS